MNFFEKISRMAITSLLWFAFTLLGLGIFGILPATAALFAIFRKWHQGSDIGSVPAFYWRYYKAHFWDANRSGFFPALIGFIFMINLSILGYHGEDFPLLIWVAFLLLLAGYLMVALFFFPVYVHYDSHGLGYFKLSGSAAALQPGKSLLMLLWFFMILALSWVLPPMIPFFTPALLAWGLSRYAQKSFQCINEKSSHS